MFGSRVNKISTGLGGVYTTFYNVTRAQPRQNKEEAVLTDIVRQPDFFAMAVKRKRPQSRGVIKKSKKPRKSSVSSKPGKKPVVSQVKKRKKANKKATKTRPKKKIKTNSDRF